MQLVDPLLKFVISSQSFSIFVEVHETSYILLYLTPLFLILSDWKMKFSSINSDYSSFSNTNVLISVQ